MKYNTKKNYITLLSVICCIAVVMLHANGSFWGDVKDPIWPLANVIECLFYFAVPCFFMITGITLFDYKDKYDTKTYFKKRIFKTVIPYLFFTTIVVIINISRKLINKETITATYILEFYFLGKVNTYWFFIPLFVLYLMIPIISLVPKEKRLKTSIYIFIVLFIANSILPFIFSVAKIDISLPFGAGVFGPLMYACLGYVISNLKLNNKIFYTSIILGIVDLLTHLLGTHFLTITSGKLVQSFKGYYAPQTVFYSLSVYVLSKRYSDKFFEFSSVNKVINFLSKYTFSIYLLHFFLQQFYTTYLYSNCLLIYSNSPIYIFTMPLLVIPSCIMITVVVRLVPIVKNLLP